MLKESETCELKECVVDDIKKEVVAFANSQGGRLYIGVNDDGLAVGVDNSDEVIQRVANMVRDAIKPDVTMFIRYDVLDFEGKTVVEVNVQRGTDRPYYLAAKGLRPEGVYVRQGTSSVPSSDTAIRKMIKDTYGDIYEEMRSLEQSLTFREAEEAFSQRAVAFGMPQMKSLGILNEDGIFSNVGQLLSDQCRHTIKAATFQGTHQGTFKDRREFTGSLLKQMNDVYAYLDMRNPLQSTFDRLIRIDHRSYPEVAIREALLNAIVHRDYAYSASTLIRVYDDRMEFVSIGGMPKGITRNDIMLGLSVCRNGKLANVFYRLQLIEAFGTGMGKIMNAYENSRIMPRIDVTENAFMITLPNLNEGSANETRAIVAYGAQDRVMDLVRKKGVITRADAQKLLQSSQTTTGRILRELCDEKVIVRDGKGKNTSYRRA